MVDYGGGVVVVTVLSTQVGCGCIVVDIGGGWLCHR